MKKIVFADKDFGDLRIVKNATIYSVEDDHRWYGGFSDVQKAIDLFVKIYRTLKNK